MDKQTITKFDILGEIAMRIAGIVFVSAATLSFTSAFGLLVYWLYKIVAGYGC